MVRELENSSGLIDAKIAASNWCFIILEMFGSQMLEIKRAAAISLTLY